MKGKILFVAAAFLSIAAHSQVGINTPSPTATLDLVAKSPTGTSTSVDGLLIPRVDRQRAQSMTAIPISTLVYINNVTTGTQTGTAVNMDTVGYYYYNSTVWAKLNVPVNNIYNTDGTLTANRTVNQTDKTLAFTATAVNAFSVDGNTLSVDAANNRLGIGTFAPTAQLHVEGTARITSTSTSRNASNASLVKDPIGNVLAKAPGYISENINMNSTVNWQDVNPVDVSADIYYVDKSATIILPRTNIAKFSDRVLRFYIYGGVHTSTQPVTVTVRNVIALPGALGSNLPSGFSYSGSGNSGTLGLSGLNVQYRIIQVFCDGVGWWVDNKN
ncbi:hypothetical protein SAMN05421594_4626 [Chryseobacterium oleae]|uniref:Fimbrillin-like n=1 Tax=Chryseobacterium oleae TaxID=491207 RepID=A0A1I5CRP9_CHROL|nr:hypothetical protein [Chryseobacterium oleae]SFN89597.1 hypothetical protein SAMN05421594_4626 [Chryseobacterium oleae]